MRATVPAERPKGGVPQQYNHEEGLKTIVVAEAAEKYFARAKNLDGLSKAIKDKLEAQRDFALWWDGLGEKRGSGPAKRCNGSDTSLPIAGQAGLPSRQVIQRWRPLEDPDNFNDALDAALEKARQLCEGDKHIRGTFATRNYECYTPAEFMA